MSRILTPPCVTAGPTITGTTPQSCRPIAAPLSLPPAFWTVGKWLALDMAGKISTVIRNARGDRDELPGSARFDLRMGGAIVWDGLAALLNPDIALTDVPWSLALALRCMAIDSSGIATFQGSALFTSDAVKGTSATQPSAAGAALLPWAATPATGATGADAYRAQDVDVFYTQTQPRASLTVQTYKITEL